MNRKKIPEKIGFIERFTSWVYSFLTVIAWILLIISLICLIIYFFSFIIHKDFFNKDFIHLCIYFIVGTFLFIFVYDEHCKNKLKKPKLQSKKKISRNIREK